MGTDREQGARGGLVLVVDLAANVGPAQAFVVRRVQSGDPAEKLEAGVIEHGRIVPDIDVSHRVAHPGMRDARERHDAGGAQDATSAVTLHLAISSDVYA